MRRIIISIVVIAGVLMAFEPTDWQYYCRIDWQDSQAEYVKFDIAPDMYEVAKRDLSDIRIIAADGKQLAYMVVAGSEESQKHKYSPLEINRTTDDADRSIITLDFGKKAIKDTVDIDTAGSNFRRAVKIEGSSDNIAFFTLVGKGFVFAVDGKEPSRFSTILMPTNDYRYLRITVEPMSDEEKPPVINDIIVYKDKMPPEKLIAVDGVLVNTKDDQETNTSEYEYDFAYRNMPIYKLEFDVTDKSFYRFVTIEGRNAETKQVKLDREDNREKYKEVDEKWNFVKSGTIYRYIDGEKQEKTNIILEADKSKYRFIRVKISNYDDLPLTIAGAKAYVATDRIIFETFSSLSANVYMGNSEGCKPKYDIVNRLSGNTDIAAAMAITSPVGANPQYVPKVAVVPWSEQHKWLIGVVLAMVVAVLGWFILKSFQSIKVD